MDISKGKGPVRLLEKRTSLRSLSKSPMWGERVPKRGTLEMVSAMTRELLSHVIPANEQCDDDDELAVQSARPELLGPTNEAFRFSKASRSEDEDEDERRRNKQGNKKR